LNTNKLNPTDLLPREAAAHFDEPWQASIFSLVVSLIEQGHISLAQWGHAVSDELKDACAGNQAYYQAWTAALEKIMLQEHWVGPMQLTQYRQAWQLSAELTEHGKPLELRTNTLMRNRAFTS
jgi:nitrile hydratase accessory protein